MPPVSLRDSDEQSDDAPADWETPPPPVSKGRRRRWFVVAVVVLVALASGWTIMAGSRSDQSSLVTLTDGAPADSVRVGISLFKPGDRVKAPTLEGDTVEGPPLQAASLRGKVVVVNVWGSWCAPCRAEAPELAKLARETKSDGVVFLGIDVRDDRSSARAFTRRYSIPYQSLFDPDGRQLARFASIIPINAVPSSAVIDRSGRVAASVVGRIDYKTLRGVVQDVLAEPGSGGSP